MTNSPTVNIPELINLLEKKYACNRKRLSQILHTDQETLSRWYTEKHRPYQKNIDKMLELLNADVEEQGLAPKVATTGSYNLSIDIDGVAKTAKLSIIGVNSEVLMGVVSTVVHKITQKET